MNMKTLFVICICSIALALGVLAQSPTVAPQPAASPTITAAASPSPTAKDDLEAAIEKKVKKHFNFTIGDHDSDTETSGSHSHSGDEIPEMVVPIVAVVFLSIFGAPVLIVAVIMYFGFSKNRMMHRTVRMMVEKGQPVPPALLAPPPPAVRQRSDMRRGVVLVMVGIGVMIFFAAVNEWEGGAWALGIIPFLIGLGYLLVWKLEGGKKEIPPLPPTP
ncbi:MAG: DUF6249 domain-containing protein [Verrucomicrobiota bacterium]|nr:DUF6249 domain-containing protein [Verrucomicrobiota bacterium]